MHVLGPELVNIIIGQKRAGKSTLAAKIAYLCHKKGIDCYCNFPVKYAKRLPYYVTKEGYQLLDKEALYTSDFSNSVVIFDEAANIWNARSHKTFTERDSHFFNMLGHIHCQVFCIVQFIDMLDLNIRRNCGEIFFVKKRFFSNLLGFSKIYRYCTEMDRVENKDYESFDKSAHVVEYKIIERKNGRKYIFRPKYYNNFYTHYLDVELKKLYLPSWSDVVNFPDRKKFFRKIRKKKA